MIYVLWNRILRLVLLLGTTVTCSPALPQDYRFEVAELDLQAYVQPDASAKLEYRIIFKNLPNAHVIDVVDIGLPHYDYDISSMSASIDGMPLNSIRKSTYIDIGVEVDLSSRPILAGRTGEFKFQCTMPDMVYQDTTDKSLASLQLVPTWFDENSTVGRTKLQVAIHLLPGVKAEDIKYQNENFKYSDLVLFGEQNQAHPVAIWQYDSWMLSASNPKLAVSFPKTGLNRVVTIGRFGMLLKWFRENRQAQVVSWIGLAILFAIIFFRFSHGTGFVLFFVLSGVIALLMLPNTSSHFIAWPCMMGLFFLNESILRHKRDKPGYLPAMASVEGGGIKRGLTAPQAGVLLEMPMGKILALVIFGLIKKGVVEQTALNPLSVRVLQAFATARGNRLQVAGDKGIVLHDYEQAFIDRLLVHDGPVKNCDMSEAFGGLVKSVVSRMAGFDLSDTQAYYRAIIERAWKEAEAVGEIAQRDEVVDRNFEWILLDEHWIDVFDRWARSGRAYRPWWERRGSGPVVISHGGGLPGGGDWKSSGGSNTSTPETSKTTLSEVAAGFAGWTENTMSSFASAIEPAKMGLDIPSGGGILDLSGVDRVTGDVFKALAESAAQGGGGRGGGGGGCACACAGCACACACAGGGR